MKCMYCEWQSCIVYFQAEYKDWQIKELNYFFKYVKPYEKASVLEISDWNIFTIGGILQITLALFSTI